MNKRQKLELAFRQHTKEVLGENAVKEFAGSELEALCVTFIQKQGQALPLVDVVGSYNLKVGDKIKMPSGLRAEVIKTKVKVKDEFGGEYYLSDIEVG